MRKQRWNDGWKVWRDKSAFSLVFAVPEDALTVDLPYDAAFRSRQNPDSPNAGSTGFIDGGVFNYYKELELSEPEQTVWLELEGVSSQSMVYVNGSFAGGFDYAYTDHFVELTDFLKPGRNRVLVVANALDRSSRYYAGGGVYRDVTLHWGGAVHIAPDTLCLTTKSLDGSCAAVEVEARLCSRAVGAREVVVRLELLDEAGRCCADERYPVRLPGGQEIGFRQRLTVAHPRAWSEHSPSLYRLRLTLLDGDRALDSDEIRTGIRTLELDALNGLRVNGQTVKLRGACIHHDQGLLGADTYLDYEYRRVSRLKQAGFNAVRSAHNPASRALLAACDALGVYVMDEAFDMWNKMKNYDDYALRFSRGWQDVLRAMVRVDRSHPSVVLYSTGNEISEIGTPQGFEMNRQMCELLHQLDPTRFTTNGVNGAFAASDGLIDIAAELTGKDPSEFADGDINKFMALVATDMDRIVASPIVGDILDRVDYACDVAGYNYMTWRYLADHEAHPNRVMVGTETYPKQIAENWSIICDCPAVIGDFTWTGYDYLGERGGPEAFPELMNAGADIDMLGNRRPVSFYREIVFGLRTQPYICVRPPEAFGTPRQFGPWQFTDGLRSWNFSGAEGRPVTVEVFSAGDEVELFVDGQSVGRRPNGQPEGCYCAFDVTYQPGSLRAVSYRGGEVVGEDVLFTAGPAAGLTATPEICHPDPERAELIFIDVRVTDALGRQTPDVQTELRLTLSGPARLLAFAGMGERHEGGFASPVAHAQGGAALAVLRRAPGAAPGSVQAVISADGLPPVSVRI